MSRHDFSHPRPRSKGLKFRVEMVKYLFEEGWGRNNSRLIICFMTCIIDVKSLKPIYLCEYNGSGIRSIICKGSEDLQRKSDKRNKQKHTSFFVNCTLDRRVVLEFISYGRTINLRDTTCRPDTLNE